jgi:hypothetical protein
MLNRACPKVPVFGSRVDSFARLGVNSTLYRGEINVEFETPPGGSKHREANAWTLRQALNHPITPASQADGTPLVEELVEVAPVEGDPVEEAPESAAPVITAEQAFLGKKGQPPVSPVSQNSTRSPRVLDTFDSRHPVRVAKYLRPCQGW